MKKIGLSCLLLSGVCVLASCGYGKKEVEFEEYKLQVNKLKSASRPVVEEFTVKGIWKDKFVWFTITSKETLSNSTEKLGVEEGKVRDALMEYEDIFKTIGEHADKELTGDECPICGAPLIYNNSDEGYSIGCPNYPFCIYSEEVKPEKQSGGKYYVNSGFKVEYKDYALEYDQYGKLAKYYSLTPNCDVSIAYTYAK